MVKRGLMPGKIDPRPAAEASINCARSTDKKTVASASFFDILTLLFAAFGRGINGLKFPPSGEGGGP
jgi:hypothetical protein